MTTVYEVLEEHGMINREYLINSIQELPLIKSNCSSHQEYMGKRGTMYMMGGLPGIWFDFFNKFLEVKSAHIGLGKDGDGKFYFYAPGLHHIKDAFMDVYDMVDVSKEKLHVQHGLYTLVTIPQGQAGYADDRGQPVILPDGMHFWKSSTMRFIKIIPTEEHIVPLGPMTLVTIDDGYCAVTQDNGKQVICEGGKVHLLTHRNWKFQKLIPLKQENMELGIVRACTRDYIHMEVSATCTWRIVDERLTCLYGVRTMNPDGSYVVGDDINKIREDVKKQCIASLVNAIGNSNYISRDWDNAARGDTWLNEKRINVAIKHANKVTEKYGVLISAIGILNQKVGSRMLEDIFGQFALIATESKMLLSAAQGEASAINIRARADAQAQVIEAKGHLDAAEELKKTGSGSDLAFQLAKMEAAGNMYNPRKHQFLFGDVDKAEEIRKLLFPDMVTAVMNNPNVVAPNYDPLPPVAAQMPPYF